MSHEGDDFEEGWFLHDHSHTHQRYVPKPPLARRVHYLLSAAKRNVCVCVCACRELYEMDDDVDDEHGIFIDQPGDDELDQPPPKDMMAEAVHE
jgi:hypothetical protein